MDTINCDNCGQPIQIDQALTRQLEAKLTKDTQAKHQQALKALKDEHEAELAKVASQARAQFEERTKQAYAQRLKDAKSDQVAKEQQIQDLTNQLTELTKSLRQSKDKERQAQLEAEKRLSQESEKIRQEAQAAANQEHQLKTKELEEKLRLTQKALDEAKSRSIQGSQQIQGEVLEQSMAQDLKVNFPFDEIVEVKQGQRGADIRQTVKSNQGQEAGLLLWETKNAKWQKTWLDKFKNDIRQAGANLGVLVSTDIPSNHGDMDQLTTGVWVVKPTLAIALAQVLRESLLSLHQLSLMNAGKETKKEALFSFVTSPEFKHRIEAIIDNYTNLQKSLEKEKRAANLRWAQQEKAIQAVIANTIGVYGDMQGLTNQSLPAIDFDQTV